MTAKKADAWTLGEIRRLAADQSRVRLTTTVQFDLMAHRLTKADVCDEIIAWIDRGEPVKEVVLHSFPGLVGQSEYEIKPRMRNTLFYIKVTLVELGKPGEYMLVVSAHPDH
ncbi:MAG: hypothetical protein GXX96_25005 [Planctomycetaceae bacterium]|nr:hypothetical protein [Planctomycetaceae bacterium]